MQLSRVLYAVFHKTAHVMHFLLVTMWICVGHMALLNIYLGPFIKRASTLKEAQAFGFEMILGARIHDAMKQVHASSFAVRTARAPSDTPTSDGSDDDDNAKLIQCLADLQRFWARPLRAEEVFFTQCLCMILLR
eukprot:2517652-Pyramimonas_sp.AAC.1